MTSSDLRILLIGNCDDSSEAEKQYYLLRHAGLNLQPESNSKNSGE